MNQKQIEGKIGEKEAVRYLEKEGYKIICSNFRCMKGEIDIIAHDNKNIIFIEVKTRTSTRYGEPKEAVNSEKQRHIYEAARYFMYINNIEEAFARIDVIEVYLHNRQSETKSHRANNVAFILTNIVKRCIILFIE